MNSLTQKTIVFRLLLCAGLALLIDAPSLHAASPQKAAPSSRMQMPVRQQPSLLPSVPDGVYFGHNKLACKTNIPKPGKMPDLPAPFDIEITIVGGKATQVTNFGNSAQILQSPDHGQLNIAFVYNGTFKFTGAYDKTSKSFKGTLQTAGTLRTTNVICSGEWGAALKYPVRQQ